MKFHQLILKKKIIKIVATRCQILTLTCTNSISGRWGAYSAPPDPLAGFEGPTSIRVGREKGGEGGEGKGEEAFLVMWPRKLSALNLPLVLSPPWYSAVA